MTRSVLFQELRFQVRHGFGIAYILVIAVYVLAMQMVPAEILPWLLVFLLLTDPVSVGLIFVGGVVQLEGSMQLTAPLFVTPLSPRRFIITRLSAFAFLGAAIGLMLMLLAPEEAFARGTLPGWFTVGGATLLLLVSSAVLTVLGVAVAYAVDSINGYILAVAPFLTVAALPLAAWLPWVSPYALLWCPSFLPFQLLSRLFGITSTAPWTLYLLGGLSLILWGVGGWIAAHRLLLRRVRLSVGGA